MQDEIGAAPAPGSGRWTERLLLGLALLVGVSLRLAEVGPAFLFGDEFHSLREIEAGYASVLTRFSPTGSGMALPLLQRVLCDLFGSSHWSLRAPAWAAGLAILVAVALVARRRFGASSAAVATALAAVSPLLVFYSHFGRAYAAVALLCLLLWELLERALERPAPTLRRLAGLAVVTALAPWLHPTALGFVLPVYAGALVRLLWAEKRRNDAMRIVATLAAAGALCLALHAPAWSTLSIFVSAKTSRSYLGEFGFWDVAALLAGSRQAAWLLAAGLAASLAALVSEQRWRALPLLCACLGPAFVVAVVSPYGDPYAYARYVFAALPPLCIVLGHGIVRACSLPRRIGRKPLGVTVGATLAAVLWASGPYGWPHTPDGPYANTYITLQPLPAFDRPWPSRPDFYRELSSLPAAERARLRLVEAPALTTRARHLYRHYYLQHGVETWLAFLPVELPWAPDGPYVSLSDPSWRERADADYLVLHLDLENEVVRYWNFVYEQAFDPAADPSIASLMQRQRAMGGPFPEPSPALLDRLQAELGEPWRRERLLAVWKLR